MIPEVDYDRFLSDFQSAKFKELWPAQRYTLGQYNENFRSQNAVAIELPTGGGKTPIALLIAETWRRNGKKVAILSANKALARQMHQEGQSLGVPVSLMEGRGVDIPSKERRSYHRANNIAVMNYWVYFNQNPVLDPADLLIMDDAHLAEHCLHSLWSVEISRKDHPILFQELATELLRRFPEYHVLSDTVLESHSGTTPTELLSFIDQYNISKRFKEIVEASSYYAPKTDLKYRWDRMRNSFEEANVYIGSDSFWIRPYIYPLLAHQHFETTQQQILLSATIGEQSDIARRLGIKEIFKIPTPERFADKTSGRRMILLNRLVEEGDIPERLQQGLLQALSIHPKSLWICTSKVQAERMQSSVSEWLNRNNFVGHPTWILGRMGDEIDPFKKSPTGHLFVAARFDGMDFKEHECRLVILATLPRAINLQEDFLCAYLRDASFMKKRLNARLVQALGRCNRSENDYAIYALADSRFATHFGRDSNRVGIPKHIRTEIDLAEDTAELEVPDLKGRISDFLNQRFDGFDSELNKLQVETPPDEVLVDDSELAKNEVIGWSAMFNSKNYSIASDKFHLCYERAKEQNLIELGAYFGWCLAKAKYLAAKKLSEGSESEALSILEEAIQRGGISSWFNRMKASLNRERNQAVAPEHSSDNYYDLVIRSFDDILEKLGARGTRFQKHCNKISERLQSANHDQFSQGLTELAELLAFSSSRPKHSAATDCRWRLSCGNFKYVVTWEAKIEHSPETSIFAKDVGQAHNQYNRAIREYQHLGYTVLGTIVSHLTNIAPEAEAGAGNIRIIQKAAILALWEKVKLILTLYRDGWSVDDVEVRKSSASKIRSFLPEANWLAIACSADTRWITEEILLRNWPSN